MAVRPAILVAALVAFGGCGLTTSLDDLAGDAEVDAGAVADAGPGAADGPSGGGSDTGAGPILLPDGGLVEGGTGRFCEQVIDQPLACLDFDDGQLPANFLPVMRGGGTLTVVQDVAKSAPHALQSFVPAAPSAGAALGRSLGTVSTQVTIDLDVFLTARASGNYDLLTFDSGDAEMGFEIMGTGALRFDEDRIHPDGGQSTIVNVTSGVVPVGSWVHVKYEAMLAGATADNRLYVENVLVGSHASSSQPFASNVQMFLGDADYANGTGDWRVLIDNVVIRVK